ncbi:MAG: preprotein translocase subunit SecG [Verrucomicrobia bacterium]|nr:preprotein translocase subunit SecG [Verrucomicrobiota bacterium]MCF7708423.1 preprotein translocase subunit SecG [Verrucomicrobiota bacterium]
MGFLIGLLTFILFLNSVFLTLVILMQLPKKEAGLGTAFGGGATEALFGAGTGNVLSVATKYSATIFLALSLILSVMNARYSRAQKGQFEEAVQQQSAAQTTTQTQQETDATGEGTASGGATSAQQQQTMSNLMQLQNTNATE